MRVHAAALGFGELVDRLADGTLLPGERRLDPPGLAWLSSA